jgi:hypothetical protein
MSDDTIDWAAVERMMFYCLPADRAQSIPDKCEALRRLLALGYTRGEAATVLQVDGTQVYRWALILRAQGVICAPGDPHDKHLWQPYADQRLERNVGRMTCTRCNAKAVDRGWLAYSA